MAFLTWVMGILEINIPVVRLSDLPVGGQKSELLISACQAVNADTYLSGIGGKEYMDLDLFEAADIQVLWQEFKPPTYPQLFEATGFIPNLSILDVLFCCGPNTRQFLAQTTPAQPAFATT